MCLLFAFSLVLFFLFHFGNSLYQTFNPEDPELLSVGETGYVIGGLIWKRNLDAKSVLNSDEGIIPTMEKDALIKVGTNSRVKIIKREGRLVLVEKIIEPEVQGWTHGELVKNHPKAPHHH